MHTSKMMEAYRDGVMFSDEDIIEGYKHFSKLADMLAVSGVEYRFSVSATYNLVDHFYRVGKYRGLF